MLFTLLRARAKPRLVRLPGWDKRPFWVLLRRPSLLTLAAKGIIPNPLLSAAARLFESGDGATLPFDRRAEALRILADAALCAPTLAKLEAAGIALTDEQLTAIFRYTQRGPGALIPFVESPTVLPLIAMSRQTGRDPAALLGVRDPYDAYCLGEACLLIGEKCAAGCTPAFKPRDNRALLRQLRRLHSNEGGITHG